MYNTPHNPGRNVYDSLFKVLYDEYNDSNLAYERLLEFLAVDNCPPIVRDIDGHLGWFFENEDVREKLIKVYDIKAVQSERYDHLGDLYLEKVIGEYEAKKRKLYFTQLFKFQDDNKNEDRILTFEPLILEPYLTIIHDP